MEEEILQDINIKESLEVKVQAHPDDNYIICELIGFIDVYNSIEFTKHINLIANHGYNNIILDCSELNYIASSGVGSFTSIVKTLEQKNGKLIFACLQKQVYDIFRILKMDKFFIIKPTIEESVNLIKN